MKNVVLYTDGACSGNPGKGGWGAILIFGSREKELCGFQLQTTNNQMELFAVIQGLEALKENCEVVIYSDSAYVVNAFDKGWIYNWAKNNWKTSEKKDVANKELWQQLLNLSKIHKLIFNKVKGHSGNQYNERCDKLATKSLR